MASPRHLVASLGCGLLLLCGEGCGGGDAAEARYDARFPSDSGVSVIAVGDIASSRRNGSRVADLMRTLPVDVFLPLGDNAYREGTSAEYRALWKPFFGRFDDRVRPTPGNHEYRTESATGYKRYFSSNAPGYPDDAEYYAFDAGGWRWFSLNSEISADTASAQYRWLRSRLDDPRWQGCIGAYWHRPLFSIGKHAAWTRMQPIWSLLAEHRTALVLTAHDHNYQRWHPIDGVVQIVVGTGGRDLYPFTRRDSRIAHAAADQHGVLHLVLTPTGAAYRFVTLKGAARDSGAVACGSFGRGPA